MTCVLYEPVPVDTCDIQLSFRNSWPRTERKQEIPPCPSARSPSSTHPHFAGPMMVLRDILVNELVLLTSEEFTVQGRIPTNEELHCDSCSNGESARGYGSLLETADLRRLGGNRTVSSRLRRDLREMLTLRTEGIGLGQEYREYEEYLTLWLEHRVRNGIARLA